MYDDETIDNENNEDENFQIQSAENEKKYVLVNTRIDYQYRPDSLNNICLSLSSRMVPNGHILRLLHQKIFQINVEYHSNTLIIKGMVVAIYLSIIQ